MLSCVFRSCAGFLRTVLLHETSPRCLLAFHYGPSAVLPGALSGSACSRKSSRTCSTGAHDLFPRDLQKPHPDPKASQPSAFDGSLESFEQYIHDPSRSVEDILSVDVRPLPAIVQLSCLEAVLNHYHRSSSSSLQSTLQSFENTVQPHGTGYHEQWPQKYLAAEHTARWSDWDLGINPFVDSHNTERQWVHSPRFELLLLATAASANQLPIPHLLRLAGHFSYLWHFYDPKVFASILRLLTGQVNELGLTDIFRLTSVVRDIPHPVDPNTSDVVDPASEDESGNTLPILIKEANLLRTALRLHVLSKMSGLDSFDAVTLLRFIEEIGPGLNKTDLQQLLYSVECSLICNPQQQSLYSLLFMCSRLSLLRLPHRGILNRIISQVQRKLRLARRLPRTDQTRWLGAVVAALANVMTGAPQTVDQSVDAVELFARPPVMPNAKTPDAFINNSGVDFSNLLTKDWVRQIFTDITGYLVSRPTSESDSSRSYLQEVAYSLALLGYRADSILEQAYVETNEPTCAPPTDRPPYVTLSELLIGLPNTRLPDATVIDSVAWLPRIEWQFYLRLSTEINFDEQPFHSGTADQLKDYVNVKSSEVLSVTDALLSRVHPRADLKLLNFHRLQLDGHDILFKKESTTSPGITKVALCFVCYKRDILISRPLQTLIQAYASTGCEIPVLVFDYSSYAPSKQAGRLEQCDSFLKDVLLKMVESPGVPSDQLKVWTDAVHIPTS
ncbi:hypothetical protein X801_05377 [Opisthorchis viverrini]|uniref:Uncharacterized protein n=2 Tax=Opisthorchis viverrini TaxID=6198 RepID=A0A075AJI8_OPIVI|nr:hypothetical protein T265_00762 [Opisthorchis viverrini]KER33459.1 hypothetical protein T265_00762 [Opisthorchis viverrini]OON18765.1 hypothetical protein X801_05377 [Opisthorchis viverrini]